MAGAGREATPTVDPSVPVHELTLYNGFRVLVVRDQRTPRVGASLRYRVGAIQEPVGEHGSTHFLEHASSSGHDDRRHSRPRGRTAASPRNRRNRTEATQRPESRAEPSYGARSFVDDFVWPETPDMPTCDGGLRPRGVRTRAIASSGRRTLLPPVWRHRLEAH